LLPQTLRLERRLIQKWIFAIVSTASTPNGLPFAMKPLWARLRQSPGDEFDADRQDLASRVEINAPGVPRFGNAERRFKQLVLHARPVASMAECRTLPHSALLDCMVRRAPSRVRFAGLRPPLTAPAGRFPSHPDPLGFQKRLRAASDISKNQNTPIRCCPRLVRRI